MIWLLVISLVLDVLILAALAWLGLTVVNLRQRLLNNARDREQWDALFADHLSSASTAYEETRATVHYLDTYLWAIRQKLGITTPVPPPPHRSKHH